MAGGGDGDCLDFDFGFKFEFEFGFGFAATLPPKAPAKAKLDFIFGGMGFEAAATGAKLEAEGFWDIADTGMDLEAGERADFLKVTVVAGLLLLIV